MFCRGISCFICIFLAFVTATVYNETDFIPGSKHDVTLHPLTTGSHESFTIEAIHEVKETAAVDLGSLLDAGEAAVVTLVAGETRLAAHRAVLAARSPVLAAMFQHDALEGSSSEVSIEDLEGPVLRQLLAYMYTGQAPQASGAAPQASSAAPQASSAASQLLAAADRFGLPGLKAACEQQVAALLSVENAAATALLALRHSSPGLQQAAVAFFKAHTHQVMMTQGWADAVVHHPHFVVELTRLISEPSAETSTPATAVSPPASSSEAQTDVMTVTPTDACHTPPPDDAAVSYFRSFSKEERDRRLIRAAQEMALENLQALLAAGADVGARDEDRRTALHWAVRRGQVLAVRCLLEAGAEVDATNNLGSTPLLWAASSGQAANVRLLVSHCADPNAKNSFGKTPLHYAAQKGHIEAAAALMKAGAKSCVKDNNGATPRDLAREGNHQQLVDFFTRN